MTPMVEAADTREDIRELTTGATPPQHNFTQRQLSYDDRSLSARQQQIARDQGEDDTDEQDHSREELQRLLHHRKRPLPPRSAQSSIADYISKSPLLRGYATARTSSTKLHPSSRTPTAGHNVLLLREDHVSLDQLNPHPNSRTRKSSAVIAMINLVATVCGGGVLSLPLAFCRAGILPTTLLMLYGAAITDFSLVCLVDSARKTGGRTYGDVAAAAFGNSAQVVTTLTLSLMLCGTLIAYLVLVKDIWTPVVFFLVSLCEKNDNHDDDDESLGSATPEEANWLLACILVVAMPLLLKRDLHALRHTCYVGFSSCVLLMLAVVYRACQKFLTTANDTTTDGNKNHPPITIKWWYDDMSDVLFAFPIVCLCYFCSYNVLAVHSQLVNPSRERIRMVLGASMFTCCCLFFGVGLCGYLYTADTTTPDNIMLAFELDDKAILAGRMGFCLTLLFGLPLVLLPCRDAIVSLPEQIQAWRRDAELVAQFQRLNETYQKTHDDASTVTMTRSRTVSASSTAESDSPTEGSPHLVINGVDFDGKEPVLVAKDPEMRHGTTIVYGSVDVADKRGHRKNQPSLIDEEEETLSKEGEDTTIVSGEVPTELLSPTVQSETEQQMPASSVTPLLKSLPVVPTLAKQAPVLNEQAPDSGHDHHDEQHHTDNSNNNNATCEFVCHVTATVLILTATYAVAISVPGVAAVWSIVGSSMAIWIAFVVPTGCFLQIRQHKGLTMQALYAWLLLAASIVAMVVCTRQAVGNAFQSSTSLSSSDTEDDTVA